MKNKIRSLICILLTLVFAVSLFQFSVSAESDFIVENGVLLKYKGTSASVTIPSQVYYIADSAFSGNKNIKSVNLNNVSQIGHEAFKNCTSLSTVSGYDNVNFCGAYAFFGTPFLINYSKTDLVMGSVLVSSKAKGSYTVPYNINSIAPYAMVNNTGITSVNIPEGVSSIGEGAFYGCTALKNVTVNKAVNYIGAYAFYDTPFQNSYNKEFFILGNGILVKYFGTASSLTVPDTVKQIAAGAFFNNTDIVSVKLPTTLTGIGMRAFAGCTYLKNINLPDSLVILDVEAFSGCTSIEKISIPSSVEVVGESVFYGCRKLKTVEYFSNADISRGMFADCKTLTSFRLSSNLKNIGELAFYNCTSLSEISLPDTITSIHSSAFNGADMVTVFCNLSSYAGTEMKARGLSVSQIGDSNMDKNLNVKDVTHIQKATAGLLTLDFSCVLRADVDFNGDVNVKDATWIQKKLAGIV